MLQGNGTQSGAGKRGAVCSLDIPKVCHMLTAFK